MNNLVCCILLFSITLVLTDAGCTEYPVINHAHVNDDSHCGDIEITCQDGFHMVQSITCEHDKWLYLKPTCEPGQCLGDPVITNGALNTNITSRDIGTEYQFTCNPGNMGTVRCNANREWETDIECEVQCLGDPVITNGVLSTNITSRDIGTEYQFTCDLEFVKNGNGGTVRCNATGEWEANQTCGDCLIRNKYFDLCTLENSDSPSCKQPCSEIGCGFSVISRIQDSPEVCVICPVPVVYFINFISIQECFEQCSQLQGCVSFYHVGYYKDCYLFNDTSESLFSYFDIKNGQTADGDIIADKNTCPSLF